MNPPAYDAVLVVSFGGPERKEDVIPFLENVVRGRRVPRERLLAVAEQYYSLGGRSPINHQNRSLVRALQDELAREGPDLPVYLGNRNWHPMLPETLEAMARDGVRHAIALATAAFSSYSSCRQYIENIRDARRVVGPAAPEVDKIRPFFNHPGFIDGMADRVSDALDRFRGVPEEGAKVLFTAHSIPMSMSANCEYVAQLTESSRLVSARAEVRNWELVFQSRSGPPSQPWLGPDVGARIRTLRSEGVTHVCVAPIGFLSDHVEVLYDLDTVASSIAHRHSLTYVRARTVGTHPAFVRAVRDLIAERAFAEQGRCRVGGFPALPDFCPAKCCPPPSHDLGKSGSRRAKRGSKKGRAPCKPVSVPV